MYWKKAVLITIYVFGTIVAPGGAQNTIRDTHVTDLTRTLSAAWPIGSVDSLTQSSTATIKRKADSSWIDWKSYVKALRDTVCRVVNGHNFATAERKVELLRQIATFLLGGDRSLHCS